MEYTKNMFTTEALEKLISCVKNDFASYEHYYDSGEEFISEMFLNNTHYMENGIINLKLPELNSNNTWQASLDNSKKLHQAFMNAEYDRAILMDERFWVWLSHTKYYTYMTERWGMDSKNNRGRVLNRYFFNSSPERRHALAHLLWFAEMTYDKNRSDQYELTRVAFEYADPSSYIFERNIGRNPKVIKAAMQVILENEENPNIKKRSFHLKYAKEVNSIAAVLLLDEVPFDELVTLLSEVLKKYI